MLNEKSFIKDTEVLKENHRVEDLFDMDSIARKFNSKLLESSNKSIIGLVGEYGTGKSTLLHKISQNIEKDFWIEFDAWKYPERKELWEGFVLDFARQIDSTTFDKVRASIDGKQNNDKKTLINTFGDIPIPGFAAIKNLKHFYETSPARRTFEIQDIFTKLLSSKAKDKIIYVVVEDIDRSGDAGIFFLETLKYFLQSLDVESTIKVIVPIANSKFYENSDSYIKCLDVVDFYQLTNTNMDKFVENVFSSELITEAVVKKQLSQFFEKLMAEPGMTPRKLKLILRKSDLNYLNQQSDELMPDFRVSILFEAAKYILSAKNDDTDLFSYFKQTKTLSNNKLFSSFAYSIATSRPLLDSQGGLEENPQPFHLIPRNGTIEQYPSTPYIIDRNFRDEHRSYCCDFYLVY